MLLERSKTEDQDPPCSRDRRKHNAVLYGYLSTPNFSQSRSTLMISIETILLYFNILNEAIDKLEFILTSVLFYGLFNKPEQAPVRD